MGGKSVSYIMTMITAGMLVSIFGFFCGAATSLAQEHEKITKIRAEEVDKLKAEIRRLNQRMGEFEKQGRKTRTAVRWKDGFSIYDRQNPDLYMRLRAALQFRYAYTRPDDHIIAEGADENNSNFLLRRLRLFLDGSAPTRNWSYYMQVRLEPQNDVDVQDAYITWKKHRTVRIQFGRTKIPAFGMEFWQSGFGQNGVERTIFSGETDAESEREDVFGNEIYAFPGGNAQLRVSDHSLRNGFPAGGFHLSRSQGINVNGYLDAFGWKDMFTYAVGVYNGRDARAFSNSSDDMLYCARIGFYFLGDPARSPMGPGGLNNYTLQGDWGYNPTPIGTVVFSAFTDRNRTRYYYDKNGVLMGDNEHDYDNYGFDTALLLRYMGLSADLEYARESFEEKTLDETLGNRQWDRWAMRVNLGYFLVPKKWELVAKYAYVVRLDSSDLIDHLQSGLGLVQTKDGMILEDNLQEYTIGVNRYLKGHNQKVCADFSLLTRELAHISPAEAEAVGYEGNLDTKVDNQDDVRLRIIYQHFF